MLYIVATPIGNLGDISERAREILSTADLIACEDTRHSGILLSRLGIKRPLISYHEHNEISRTAELSEKLQNGLNLALISDAGTPLLSDPGYRIVTACHDLGIPCTVIPGPCAITAALAGSGLPPQPFYFGGFLPIKSGRRQNELTRALEREATSIYYESPHRLLKSLSVLKDLAPTRTACVARELTKTFEEFRRDTTENLFNHYQTKPPKGEITLLIAPC
ncbi:MAG: 16S rRNA (cytidine(1402)-2'-O)-methyltransferase [Chthoniobacterales bacterium]